MLGLLKDHIRLYLITFYKNPFYFKTIVLEPSLAFISSIVSLIFKTISLTSVKASLKNSCFTVVLGEWLKNYYKDIVIKISTTNNIYSFDQYSASEDVDHLIFIKPGQTLKVSGTAKKKQTDVEVEFPATVIAGGKLVEAETKYTITIDHSSAGGETISIGFDGTFTDIEPQAIELNPEV